MRLFDLDSPLMSFLGKMADLMWLNILTMICCIPIVTAGASFTALHYMALKIVRNEECYITKGFLKSFRDNFKQATIIWLLMILVVGVIVGDYYIIIKAELELHNIIKIVIFVVAVLALFTMMYVFPVLAKFANSIRRTLFNAFIISILQFPKTILMMIFWVVPVVLFMAFFEMIPIVIVYGFSLPALGSAFLYNKFFQKLEEQVTGENGGGNTEKQEDEHIFRDELVENVSSEGTVG